MKIFLLSLLLCPLFAFGQSQGTTIRASNGFGTNTLFYGTELNLSIGTTTRQLYDASGVVSLNWNTKSFAAGWTFLSITNHTDVSAGAFVSGGYFGYNGLTGKFTNGPPSTYTAPLLTNSITATFDGAGGVITTNITRYLTVPYNCDIIGFTMLSDTTTISVVDIMRTTYALFDAGSTHPVIADKITASLPPTINPSLYKTNVTSVATWSASLTNGNVIAFRTITNTAATTLSLTLIVTHAP